LDGSPREVCEHQVFRVTGAGFTNALGVLKFDIRYRPLPSAASKRKHPRFYENVNGSKLHLSRQKATDLY
jgi:hypothetical protein